MYLKIHENAEGRIVAVCDKDLIGKVFESKSLYLDLDKYRSFYIGELATEEMVKNALKRFTSVNIVGKKAVNVAVKNGLVGKDEIKYINKVPYIQVYKI